MSRQPLLPGTIIEFDTKFSGRQQATVLAYDSEGNVRVTDPLDEHGWHYLQPNVPTQVVGQSPVAEPCLLVSASWHSKMEQHGQFYRVLTADAKTALNLTRILARADADRKTRWDHRGMWVYRCDPDLSFEEADRAAGRELIHQALVPVYSRTEADGVLLERRDDSYWASRPNNRLTRVVSGNVAFYPKVLRALHDRLVAERPSYPPRRAAS